MSSGITALQHYYTSCRRGMEGGPGFQMRSVTQGLEPSDRSDVERRGSYAAPRGVPLEPSPEEIRSVYPTAMRYYRLESGRWALTLSSYVGKDYSGRWGNYFAHTLVVDAVLLPAWPLDYYEWNGWKRCLLPEEDSDIAPEPLPLVLLADIAPAQSFSFEELRLFIAEAPERRALLATMVRAVLHNTATSRAVIIRDSFLNGLFWAACVHKAFPLAYAKHLSLSTYQFDERNCGVINATVPGSQLTCDDAQATYQFFVFDLIEGRTSQVPVAGQGYADAVAGWMADGSKQIENFFRFTSLFSHEQAEPGLDALAWLYRWSIDDRVALDAMQRAAILAFAERHVRPGKHGEVLPGLSRIASTLDGPETGQEQRCYLRFLGHCAANSGEAHHRQQTIQLWLDIFDRFIADDPALVDATRRDLFESLGGFAAEIATGFLGERHWGQLKSHLGSLAPDVLERVLSEVQAANRVLGRHPTWDQPLARTVITALLRSGEPLDQAAERILRVLGADEDSVVGLCRAAMAGEDTHAENRSEAFGRALARILAVRSPAFAQTVRKRLDETGATAVLYGELTQTRVRWTDPEASYQRYAQSVLRELPGYERKYGERIARELVANWPRDRIGRQAIRWLEGLDIPSASTEFLRQCVLWVNAALPLDPRNGEWTEWASRLEQLARTYNVRLVPNRPALRMRVREARDKKMAPIQGLAEELDGIDASGYREFLDVFLHPCLTNAGARTELHGRVLWAVVQKEHETELRNSYRRLLSGGRSSEFSSTEETALLFWLGPSSKEKHWDWLRSDAIDVLVERLARLGSRRLVELEQRILEHAESPEMWKQIRQRVERERPHWNKLLTLFTRKKN